MSSTSTSLTIAVPTWNRAKNLDTLLSTITGQTDVQVIVQDHGSTDETSEVIKRYEKEYPFVRGVSFPREDHHDYSNAFRNLFLLPETEWTWTIGDDDILLSDAVKTIWPILEKDNLEFIHVSEASRTRNSGALVKGNLLDLCNAVGWIEMTGFISGNITRTKWLKKAAALETWDQYAKGAFVQSCVLLELLHSENCAFFDLPLIDAHVDDSITEQTNERWAQFNVPLRYHYIDEQVALLQKKGAFTKVTPKFFRYLSYHLWDRFLQNIYNSYTSDQDFKVTDYLLDLLQRCLNLTKFLPDEDAKRYAGEIMEVKQQMIAHEASLAYAIGIANKLGGLVDYHGRHQFDFQYLLASSAAMIQAQPNGDGRPKKYVAVPPTPAT